MRSTSCGQPPSLRLNGLFICMACGVTFALVRLIRSRAVGSVSGIVGAGGNFGPLAATLFKSESVSAAKAFLIVGSLVAAISFCIFALRFQESGAPVSKVEAILAPMPAD